EADMRIDERRPELRTASISEISAREISTPEMVTVVIQHEVRAGAEAGYEQWLSRIIPIAGRFPGHRGVQVVRPLPGSHSYTVTLRFDTLEHAQDWLKSEARQQLVAEVSSLLAHAEELDTVTGLEFWFAPPGPAQKRARLWKQFLITLSVI